MLIRTLFLTSFLVFIVTSNISYASFVIECKDQKARLLLKSIRLDLETNQAGDSFYNLSGIDSWNNQVNPVPSKKFFRKIGNYIVVDFGILGDNDVNLQIEYRITSSGKKSARAILRDSDLVEIVPLEKCI